MYFLNAKFQYSKSDIFFFMLINEEKLKKEEDFSTIYDRLTDSHSFSIDYFNHSCANIQKYFDDGNEEFLLSFLKISYELLSLEGINYNKLVDSLNNMNFMNFIINCLQQGFSPFSSSFAFLLLQIMKIPPDYRVKIVSDDITSAIIDLLCIPNDKNQEQQVIYLLQTLQRAFCVDNYSTEFIEDAIHRLDAFFNQSLPYPLLINELLNVLSAILLIQTDHINETYSTFLLEHCIQIFHLNEAKEGICYTLASILSTNQDIIEVFFNMNQLPDFLNSFTSITDAFLAFLGQVFRCENENFVDSFFEIIPWNLISHALEENTEITNKTALFLRDIIEYWPKYVSNLETNGIFSILTLNSKQSNFSISSACIDCVIAACNYISTDCISLLVEKGFLTALSPLMSNNDDDDEIDRFLPLLHRILHYCISTLGPNAIIFSQEYDDNDIDELIDECEEEEMVNDIHEMSATLRQYREDQE